MGNRRTYRFVEAGRLVVTRVVVDSTLFVGGAKAELTGAGVPATGATARVGAMPPFLA